MRAAAARGPPVRRSAVSHFRGACQANGAASCRHARAAAREQNCAADGLSSGDLRRIDPALRVQVKPEELCFLVFDQMIAGGEEMYRNLKDDFCIEACRMIG